MLRGTTPRGHRDTDIPMNFISRTSNISLSDKGYIDTSRNLIFRASDIYQVTRIAKGSGSKEQDNVTIDLNEGKKSSRGIYSKCLVDIEQLFYRIWSRV